MKRSRWGAVRYSSEEQRPFLAQPGQCLHGLKAGLCDDGDSPDGYLPPQVAQLPTLTRPG
ncbi:hypothetical protein ABZ729_26465 [Streptomyces sp. NPDC006678]|uniref:hypothetical protein n=1 Tax=Streptomyces sp. NPDC006678 TaxID=3157185 RepID=UPI0033D2B14E